ncbi:MAG: hypothetical protein ACK5LN_06205 [Propioniciclava sp.]
MTEGRQGSSEPDRAERAMRSALRAHAEDVEFAPLDPQHLQHRFASGVAPGKATSRRAPAWLAVAAVLLVVLIVPVGGIVMRNPGAPTGASAPTEEVASTEVDRGSPESFDETQRSVRQEVMLDVAVEVPADWGYGFAPGADWCEAYVRPSVPFVDRDPLKRRREASRCADQVPDDLLQSSLTWRRAEADDVAVVTPRGAWVVSSRVVGSAYLTVMVPRAEAAVATRILDSARVVVAGPRGCATRLDPGRPTTGELGEIGAVNEVVVCQYDMDGSPGPNLVGSRALYGEAAQAILDEMLASPMMPMVSSEAASLGGQTLVMRFGGGVRQVQIDLAASGTHLLDDGQIYRMPSRVTCGDLITGPLWVTDLPAGLDVCRPV